MDKRNIIMGIVWGAVMVAILSGILFIVVPFLISQF